MELVAEVDDDDVLVLPFLLPLLFLALDDSAPLPPLEDEAGEPPPLLFTEGLMVVNVGSMKMSKGHKARAARTDTQNAWLSARPCRRSFPQAIHSHA